MNSDWLEIQLGDFLELKRGYDLPIKRRIAGGVEVISSSGPSGLHYEAKVKGPGVVTGRYGTIGKVFYSERDFWPLNTTLYVKDFKGNHPEFVYYFLKTLDYLQYSDKAAVPGVNRNHLHKAWVRVPSNVADQIRIAKMLSVLDRKITLNTQINQTLEQMAQALFKSWFVDFDLVIDNALEAGNLIPEPLAERAARRQAMWAADHETAPARLPAETRRLFPDRFEEDEVLGWVPVGWKATRLSDISTELRRGISPKYIEEGGIRVVNQKCIRHHEVNFSLCRRNDPGAKKVDGRFLELGDLLINSTGTGTLGRIAMVEQLPEPTVVDSHVTVVRADPKVYPKHVLAQQMIFLEPHVTALGEGSTGQTELSRKMVADTPIVMPEFKCLEQLEAKINVFSQARSQNRNQVEVLTQLRDTLLPKLLSGELQLQEAEAVVENALEAETV
ncbi:restriction endonuclease subunit S [Halomonas llamarensis]|uniref:Restriction endonuclease subunit S n=1 Tax=Halomonas llamarensis TaxID=2945104 RepID=A0ABT0SME1_9GAMM|nr:restriction endonuclease subunit S [Halomonas llamarensis]MCL7928738.1 restriction endonuclease subunit S [Halomonas llamarensis]